MNADRAEPGPHADDDEHQQDRLIDEEFDHSSVPESLHRREDVGDRAQRHPPPRLARPLELASASSGNSASGVNSTLPRRKPTIALTGWSLPAWAMRCSTAAAVSRVAWMRSNGEGCPPRWT